MVGTGLTICNDCGKAVPVVLGFCDLCGEVFPNSTLNREVTQIELPEAA